MITSFYSKRIAINLTAATFACLAVFTYGRWHYLDIFSICVLSAVLIFSRFNVNIVATVIIIVSGRLLETMAFYLITNTWYSKATVYLIVLFTLFHSRHDKLFTLSFITFALCIAAEQWWYHIDYPAPEIFYSMLTIAIGLVVRKLLIIRPYLVYQVTGKNADFTRVDWHIAKVYGFAIMVEVAYISEYIIRHTTSLSPTIIYALYPMIMHAFSSLILWLLFKFVMDEKLENKMKA
jgi:hypothetical protein